ncbi:NAD(P)-binding protein [Clavulina sp. PMI_390]|nr:NAD(P)-binding protein [Clavulina sp. PMI_390]
MQGVTAFDAQSTSDEVAKALSGDIRGKNGTTLGSLGAEAAGSIAKYANLIILCGRNSTKLEETTKWITEQTPSANLRPLVFDMSSLDGARKAAAEVLINSAGVMAVPYSKTVDGFESHMGINHFAPFVFTSLLYPLLARSGTASSPSRIVNVSSFGHRRSPMRFDDLGFQDGKTYDCWLGYGQSKTANILFTNELAKRTKEKEQNVVAYSLHPGFIFTTNLAPHLTIADFVRLGSKNEKGEVIIPSKTAQQGAATYIVAAFDPSIVPHSGAYLLDADVANSQQPHAKSPEDAQRLWALSETLTQQPFDI